MAEKKNSRVQPARKSGNAKTPSSRVGKPRVGKAAGTEAAAEPGTTIVGIAGSAGSLAALQSFFSALPPETGMAFVVVTHLSPEHESHLPMLLQPHTHMAVAQVTR